MAGGFEVRSTESFDNGSTAYVNATGKIYLPYRYFYLSEVVCIDTAGNGSNRSVYLYDDGPYTTEVNEHLIYTNSTFTSDAMIQRGLWRFACANGTHTNHDGHVGAIYYNIRSNGTNGTNGTTMAYTIKVGGFGIQQG